MNDIVVIGGGAAGMMAAISAGERGAKVSLLEPNERLGKKLNITGKGRCNMTNDSNCDELLQNVPRNGKFLYSAFSRFDGKNAMAFFAGLGVPIKVERGRRVFPMSDRSFDVSGALEKRLRQLGVKLLRRRAESIETEEGRVAAVTLENGERLRADAIILATGGVSYPATGSTGEGHHMAKILGHTITPLQGSLVPLQEAGADCAELQGLSLRNVGFTVFENNKRIYQDFGELLFTHFGLSGPLVLSASAHMRHFGKKSYFVEIDLKPALDEQTLDKRLLSDFEKFVNQDFGNALGALLPGKLIPQMVRRSGIDPHCKVHSITKEQRRELLRIFKHYTIAIEGPRPVSDAIVTSGGVKVGEIDPKSMESKLVKGLYFAGELIDVDAYTGGFNLQIAWATGRAAGFAAAEQQGE